MIWVVLAAAQVAYTGYRLMSLWLVKSQMSRLNMDIKAETEKALAYFSLPLPVNVGKKFEYVPGEYISVPRNDNYLEVFGVQVFHPLCRGRNVEMVIRLSILHEICHHIMWLAGSRYQVNSIMPLSPKAYANLPWEKEANILMGELAEDYLGGLK